MVVCRMPVSQNDNGVSGDDAAGFLLSVPLREDRLQHLHHSPQRLCRWRAMIGRDDTVVPFWEMVDLAPPSYP